MLGAPASTAGDVSSELDIDLRRPNLGERGVLTQMKAVVHDAHSAEAPTAYRSPARWLGKFSLGDSVRVLCTERRRVIKFRSVDGTTSWLDTVELRLFRWTHRAKSL